MTPTVRHVRDGDWLAVAELEASAYAGSGLSEGRWLLESRGGASPATSFVLDAGAALDTGEALDTGAAIAGYLLAMPYPEFRYPDLTQPEPPPVRSPNLHLHDLVIGGGFRGKGLATYLLGHLTEVARSRGHDRISLIAVAGSTGFWSARNFHPHPEIVIPPSYGADAVYLSREI